MQSFDALVVGAGPAGLAGALYLARFRRSVLVVDDGDSRAARIPRSHNVAGFEGGIPGTELLAVMRRQAEAVGVRFQAGRAETVERDVDAGVFVARGGGFAGTGRVLLLATGALDVEPPLPDVQRALVEGALRYCPVCDGYEVDGASVGVLCDSEGGLREAVYLHHFSPRVTAFVTADAPAFDAELLQPLAAHGIAFHPEPVTALELADGGVRIRHGGQWTRCDSLYSALGMNVRTELGTALGVALDGDGYLVADRHQETQTPGVFIAGDVARGLNQISVGIGAAAIAACAMHRRLSRAVAVSTPTPPLAAGDATRDR